MKISYFSYCKDGSVVPILRNRFCNKILNIIRSIVKVSIFGDFKTSKILEKKVFRAIVGIAMPSLSLKVFRQK